MSTCKHLSTLRHSETIWTAQKRYAGSIDVPLSAKGRQDCLQAAKTISDLHFEIVISSTLGRARETCDLVCLDGARREESALCRERCFGIMEGLTSKEVKELDPPVQFIAVGNDLHAVDPQGGERLEDVWQRAMRFRDYIFDRYAGRTVLVVSHGVFLQMFHGVLRGSNHIDSLMLYPATLQLTSFDYRKGQLVSEKAMQLAGATGADF